MTWPRSGHLHKDARYCNAPLNVFSAAKLATMHTPSPAPNEDASALTWLRRPVRLSTPLIYRSHWSERTLSPLSSLPAFQSLTSLSRISSNSPKDRSRDNAQLWRMPEPTWLEQHPPLALLITKLPCPHTPPHYPPTHHHATLKHLPMCQHTMSFFRS